MTVEMATSGVPLPPNTAHWHLATQSPQPHFTPFLHWTLPSPQREGVKADSSRTTITAILDNVSDAASDDDVRAIVQAHGVELEHVSRVMRDGRATAARRVVMDVADFAFMQPVLNECVLWDHTGVWCAYGRAQRDNLKEYLAAMQSGMVAIEPRLPSRAMTLRRG